MKKLSILGSTGSIGQNCLKIVEENSHLYKVIALSAGNNINELFKQIRRFRPRIVSIANPISADLLKKKLTDLPLSILPKLVTGLDGLLEVATYPETNLVVSSIVGITGLEPTVQAIKHGKTIALANKELMVVAGELITKLARNSGIQIIPVDSEHSAIHQCLRCGQSNEVSRIILTASGGPFLNFSDEALSRVTPKMALNHPTWKMGNRITIDSATLMNKGLEVLEAQWLFNLKVNQISVIIHPQSIIHSMVEFVDGSLIAQLGLTDMCQPIHYALNYPKRTPRSKGKLDLTQLGKLELQPPDFGKFPCLELAFQAAQNLGSAPCVLNAADEVAVDAFLKKELGFQEIPKVIAKMMKVFDQKTNFSSVTEIVEYDKNVRAETYRLIQSDFFQKNV